jgi:predicted O-methyltransferase YrrM
MAVSAPRLALSGDAAGRGIARAVRDASLGRLDERDRGWVRKIEARRESLLADETDTGPAFDPGSIGPEGRFSMGHERTTVGVASAFMSLPPPWCLLLFRLVRELRPSACLELGAGFGISGCYLTAALEQNSHGRLTTLEGAEEWAAVAREGFRELGLESRVDLRVGAIAESLAALSDAEGRFDLAFIDAEHQAEATVHEFAAVLPVLAPGAVVAIDDVDWPPVRAAFDVLAGHERAAVAEVTGRVGLIVTTDAAG